MLSHKAHYWKRWRLTKDLKYKQAYKTYSVKCTKAIQAFYRELETALVQSDNLGKFYRYVNGRMSGRKSISILESENGKCGTARI